MNPEIDYRFGKDANIDVNFCPAFETATLSHLSQAGMLAIYAHAKELPGIETRQKKREEEVAPKK